MLEPVKFLFILTGASTYLVTKYIKVGLDDPESNNNQTTNTAVNESYLNSQNQTFWSTNSSFVHPYHHQQPPNSSNTSSYQSFPYEDVRLGHRIHHRHRYNNNNNRNSLLNQYQRQQQKTSSISNGRIADGTLKRIHDRYDGQPGRPPSSSSSSSPSVPTLDINQQQTTSTNFINQQQNPSNPYHIALIPPSTNTSSSTLNFDNNSTTSFYDKKYQNWASSTKTTSSSSSTRTPTFEIEINEEDDRSLPKRLLQITLTNDDSTNLVSDQQRFVHYFIEEDINDEDYFLQQQQQPNKNDADFNELAISGKGSGTGGGTAGASAGDRFSSSSSKQSANNNQNENHPNFSINSTSGEIFVLRPLDRDRPNGRPWYKLNAYAQNIHTKQILGFADIWIYLKNINDNIPFFPERIYYGNVTENGTVGLKVIQMKAIDYDDDDDDDNDFYYERQEFDYQYTNDRTTRNKSNLIYSIEQNQMDEHQQQIFNIDPYTGWITTMVCCLDRELNSNYTIVVAAQDPGGFKTNTTVIVTLLDQNDCPPQFIQKEFHLEIDENDTADSLLLLDSSPTNISSLQQSTWTNSIHSNNSMSSSSSSSSAAANIMFANQSSTNKFNQKVLVKLLVEDEDLPQTNHFLFKILSVRYSSQPLFNRFKQHSFINKENDDDKISLLLNMDNDNSPLNANDSHFIIEQQTTNVNSKNEESFKNRVSSSAIGIGGTSALLILSKPLDYEIPSHRFIMLTVAVTDLGTWLPFPADWDYGHMTNSQQRQNYQEQHIDICYIYIKIRDTNDNRPIFVQHFINVSLAENIPVGSVIAKFQASDSDQNGHSPVQYSLDSITNQRRYFTIDSDTGFVRLNRALDRETTSLHIVKVLASDMDEPVALSSTATLVVNVEDVNDNSPFIINTTLSPIRENSHPNLKIGEIYAFDKDDYSKGNGPPFTFTIDPSSDEDISRRFRLEVDHNGEGKAILFAKTTFDRESQKRYNIPIVVSDAGYPSLSATCTVTVTIGDINDNDMKDGWKNVLLYSVVTPQQQQQQTIENNAQQHRQQKINHVESLVGLIELGQINVDDPDDWDLDDKQFSWFQDNVGDDDDGGKINKKNYASAGDGGDSSLNFYLDSSRGLVYAKHPIIGFHQLKFQVFDRRYQHRVQSKMNIHMKSIPLQAVINSGSLRIVGMDPFDFIAIWDWRLKRKITSPKERLEHNLKRIIGCDSLEIISIMDNHHDRSIDVRYYGKSNDGHYFTALYLNSMVKLKADLLKNETNLNITQIGINECMYEEYHLCEQYFSSSSPTSSSSSSTSSHGCFTEVSIDWTNPYHLIDANFTSFIGVNLLTKAKCSCYYDELLSYMDHKPVCDIDQALCSMAAANAIVNGTYSQCHIQDRIQIFTRSHRTSISSLNFKCILSNNNHHYVDHSHLVNHQYFHRKVANSPPIMQNIRSFKSDGVVWLDPLPICQSSTSTSITATNTQGNILSLQISTTESNGIIFYYGPIITATKSNSQSKQNEETDFMLLELVNGSPRLLFDFGSGMHEITINNIGRRSIDGTAANNRHQHDFLLNDGNWHQLEIYFDQSVVRLMLDGCVPAYIAPETSSSGSEQRHHYHGAESSSTSSSFMDTFESKCQNHSIITKFQHVLNVNGPFQLGGIYGMVSGARETGSIPFQSSTITIPSFIMENIMSQRMRAPRQIYGFTGCIRNLIYNNHVYDLINVHHSVNSHIGCHSSQSLCAFLNKRCLNNGYCDGSYNHVRCHCPKGFYGARCDQISMPVLFRQKSFIHLSLNVSNINKQTSRSSAKSGSSFKSTFDETNFYRISHHNAGFITKIDFYFRTRQWNAQMIKLIGKNARTYCLVELRNGRLSFRYQLNSAGLKSFEQRLILESFAVNDGRWHHVQAFRYGQSAKLTLDQGGIGKSTQILQPENVNRRKLQKSNSMNNEHKHYEHQFHSTSSIFDMNEHQVVLGGDVNYLGLGAAAMAIQDDFADGCISDLKINDIDISLGDYIRSSSSSSMVRHKQNLNNNQQQHSTTTADLAEEDEEGRSLVKISITKQQNVEHGCQAPVDSCRNLHCRKPFRCVDEWMMAKCRCPNGYVESNNGKTCIKSFVGAVDSCHMNPWCVCAANNQQQQHDTSQQPFGHDEKIKQQQNHSNAILSRYSSSKSTYEDDCLESAGSVNTDQFGMKEGHLEEHYLVEDEFDEQRRAIEHIGNVDQLNENNMKKTSNTKTTKTTTSTFANAQIFQLEYYGLYFIILIVLIPLNIPFILYIGYICCRNRRQRQLQSRQPQQPSSSVNSAGETTTTSTFWNPVKSCPSTTSSIKSSQNQLEDIRENIICYRDEGGGECDIGAYDMVPLRIQIQHHQTASHRHITGTMTNPDAGEHHLLLKQQSSNHAQNPIMNSKTRTGTTEMEPTTTAQTALFFQQPDNQTTSDDVWQELTVI